MSVQLVDDLNHADVVMTLKNYYRQQPQPISTPNAQHPIYVLLLFTVSQMGSAMVDIFHIPPTRLMSSPGHARRPRRIQQVLNGASDFELGRSRPPSAASNINWPALPTL
jgi:hypothetical protein